MIPRTFLSTYAVNGQQQMVVAFLDNITGLTRWVDYIPVKLAQGGRENSYDNNGFIDVAVVAKSLTSVPFKDYVPVYADTAATDAWQVNFTGYIPYGYAGSGDASLMLDFTSNFQAFDSRITFTRASNATYFNSAGLLTNTSFNALTYSNNLENAAWTKTAATVTANVTTGPFGVVDAESLTEDTATSDHKIAQATASSVATQQTFSIYAKADTRSVLSLTMNNTSGNAQFNNFDLTAGTATGSPTTSLGWTGATASIVSVGNGWYRCILTANSSGTAGITATTAMVVGGSTSYTGNGTSGLFLYGAQLQTGVISAYIPTTTVANSTPRLDYNPATLAAQGLLIEEQRVNLLTYSSDFDNAGWTKTNATVSANVVASPTGNVDADALIEDTATTFHSINFAGTSFTSGSAYTLSVFAKLNTRSILQLTPGSGAFSTGPYANFNLTTGVVSATGAGATATIQNVGSGWYRCTMTATADTTATALVFITLQSSATAARLAIYTGDGTSGIYLYGAQLEAGAFATSYAPSVNTFTSRSTTGTFFDSAGVLQRAAINVARNTYNPANLAAQPFLLLEEARTNLLTYSEQFDNAVWTKNAATVTANATIAPDGTVTADKLVENTATSDHSMRGQTVSVSSGATYTQSIYLKAGERTKAQFYYVGGTEIFIVDLITGQVTINAGSPIVNVTPIGNGWFRIAYVQVASSTSLVACYFGMYTNNIAYTGDGVSGLYMWGAQLEAGAFATSVIPTTTTALTRAADLSSSAQATRAADVASVNTLSPWYNASEGTLYSESLLTRQNAVADNQTATIRNPANTSQIKLLYRGSGATGQLVIDTAVIQADLTATGVIPANTTVKMALAYAANNFAASGNGGAVVTDASGTVPSGLDQMTLGANNFNGYLRRITYYPRALSNAELQSLTT